MRDPLRTSICFFVISLGRIDDIGGFASELVAGAAEDATFVVSAVLSILVGAEADEVETGGADDVGIGATIEG